MYNNLLVYHKQKQEVTLDNFGQEEEKELSSEVLENVENTVDEGTEGINFEQAEEPSESFEVQNNVDIQFEEVIDIDKIQSELNRQMGKDEPQNITEESQAQMSVNLPVVEEPVLSPIAANSKKYVIYVDPYNVDYIESLSINERRSVINKVLREQNEFTFEQREFQKKKQFLIHLAIALVTFVISFPLLFFCVNKSMELTIANYNNAKQNITRLYKSGGKIKPQSMPIDNIKY